MPLKIHKILENKGALQETPCKHDWKIPKDVRNPYLKGVFKVSPRNDTTKKKSLKKMMTTTGTS